MGWHVKHLWHIKINKNYWSKLNYTKSEQAVDADNTVEYLFSCGREINAQDVRKNNGYKFKKKSWTEGATENWFARTCFFVGYRKYLELLEVPYVASP